jgi:antibiotic biosynthesis monooxygenase (ABM) superfamily enzyme
MSDTGFAKTPKPPYYAVIFTSVRTAGENDYGKTADRMVELASQQPGFLGVEAEHVIAQETGKRLWYQHYELRVAKVERAYAKRP